MIPLFLDLKGKHAVVYGAGPVGQRKAAFLAREAEVTMVDRHFLSSPNNVNFVQGEVLEQLQLMEGADLVVAATDDAALNELICEEAAARGKWYNRADGTGTFLIPSMVERANFRVAISTEGRSPGMSRLLKEHIDRNLPPTWEQMVELMEMVRGQLKAEVPEQVRRESVLRKLSADPEIWESLSLGMEAAFQMAMRKAED